MFRRLSTTQLVVDVGIGVIWFLLNGVTGGVDVLRFGVAFGMGATLALRRLSPGLALAVAWVFSIGQLAFGGSPLPANLAILPMLFATAAYGDRVVRWVGFASSFVGAAVVTVYVLFPALVYRGDGAGLSVVGTVVFVFGGSVAAFLLSWTAGLLFRTWRLARENRRAAVAAEHEVVAEQERTRIARDMHDVVAHSLAVVVAQADGARYLRSTDPDAVDAALQTIATTAREALSDVRVLLAQLRHNQADGPQPTLVDLDRLIEQVEASGLTVERELSGTPLPLGTGQQLAIYRIVQESLTNALRHADTERPVALRFAWTPHGLDLTVASALRPGKPEPGRPEPRPAGHGLAGMSERALLVGGHLSAAAEDGRFVVHAWLPAHPAEVAA